MWANPAHYISGGPNQFPSFLQHGPTYSQDPHSLPAQYESFSLTTDHFLSYTNDQANSPELFHTESSFMQEETQPFPWQSIPTPHLQIEQVPPEKLSLFYQDPQGEIQGPFLGAEIITWFHEGFFGIDLYVCLSNAPKGTPFQQLGEVMPHLIQKDQPDLTQAQNPSSDDFQTQAQFQTNSFDSVQSSTCQSELAPFFFQTQLNFAEEMIQQNDQIIQAQDQTISKIMSHLSQLSAACRQLEWDQQSSYSAKSPESPFSDLNCHSSPYSKVEISMPEDIESIDNEEIKENLDLKELEKEASIIKDMKLEEPEQTKPNSPFGMGCDDYADLELDLVKEDLEADKINHDQLLVSALSELDMTLTREENKESISVENELSATTNHTSWNIDELEILPKSQIEKVSFDIGKVVDLPLPISDISMPKANDNILQLADWSTPPTQLKLHSVEDSINLSNHFLIFNTNSSVGCQQSILTKSDLPIANTGLVMEVNDGENIVRIEVCNTYKDFKLGVEEYYVIDDMILPPPFSDHGSSFRKLDPPCQMSGPQTFHTFLQWYKGWKLKLDKFTWWLILNATCWKASLNVSG